MRQRTTPHVPACSSTAYDVGGRTIHLLPASPVEVRALAHRLPSLVPEVKEKIPPEYIHHTMLWSALLVGMTWDDPDIEIETVVPESDLRTLDDTALLDLARSLYHEITSRAACRFCVPALLLGAGVETASGEAPRGNAPGTPQTSPVSTS